MNDSILKQFAAELAKEPDEAKWARMIARAKLLAAQEVPDTALEPPIRTLGDYLAAEIEMPPVLIHPFMCVRGGLNVTVGRAGKGKTVMNLNRMLRWSAGLPWFDGWTDKDGIPLLAPDKPLRVLIVENEGAAGMFHRQIGLMLHADGYLTDEQRELAKQNCLVWGEGGYSNLKLDDEHKLNELRAGVEKWEPDLVFIEPFRSLWKGEENSATEMNVVVDALVGLATDFNCGVWAAHHEKKGGHGEDDKMSAARGSTVLEGVVTVMENFESTKGGEYREVTWSKSRHEKAPNPVSMEWDAENWWYKWVPSDRVREDIIDALRENDGSPMNVTALAEATDYARPKLNAALKDLVKDGKIKKEPSISTSDGSTGPRYRLPTEDGDGGYGGLSI